MLKSDVLILFIYKYNCNVLFLFIYSVFNIKGQTENCPCYVVSNLHLLSRSKHLQASKYIISNQM